MKRPKDFVQVPQGGMWRFREPQTGVVIESNHHKDFLSKVHAHREANGLFTGGGWQDEVWHLFVLQNPQIEAIEVGEPERHLTLDDIRRFAVTMSNWIGQGAQWVSQDEAERRATICTSGANGQKCPYNKVVNGCWGCKGALNWIMQMLGGRSTSKDDQLESCSKCYCSLRAKVHLPENSLRDETVKDLPEFCWLPKH